jgi:hypothetical protein
MIQAGSTTQINGAIATSYGIDLIELQLDPSTEGKTLQLTFKDISDPEDEFNVELWKNKTLENTSGPEAYSDQTSEPRSRRTENGFLALEIGDISMDDFNNLGLIITRMDPHENVEASGSYLIQVQVQ